MDQVESVNHFDFHLTKILIPGELGIWQYIVYFSFCSLLGLPIPHSRVAKALQLPTNKGSVFMIESHHLEISYYVNFLGRLGSNGFQLKWRFGTQTPEDRFGATS